MARLEGILRDLEGYIERRAAELAAPLIAEADKRTEEKEAELQHEIERREHLGEEFRRCLDAKERQIAHWRGVATGKAADLIVRYGEVRPGDWMLDGAQLAEVLTVGGWDDYVSFALRADDGRRWDTDDRADLLTAVRREVKP